MMFLLLLLLLFPLSFILSFYVFKRRRRNDLIIFTLSLLSGLLVVWIMDKYKRKKYNHITPSVIKQMQKLNIKFHLVYGTFLFTYRNKNFADDDLDLGIFREDFNDNELQSQLKKIGFTINEQWGLEGKILEQNYKNSKLKISMDIFVIDKNKNLGYVFDEKRNRYGCLKHFPYETKEYELNEIKFQGPAQAENYFEWHYGNWKKPDPNYHWFYGPPSVPRTIVNEVNIEYCKFTK